MLLRKTIAYFGMLFLILIPKSGLSQIQQKPKLIVFDMSNRDLCVNKPFFEITEQFWNLKYLPLDKIMDTDLQEIRPEETQAAFFIFGVEWLKGLLTQSPISQKTVQIIEKYSNQSNNLLGLCFPSININPETNLVDKFKPIFEPLLTSTDQKNDLVLTDTNLTSTNLSPSTRAFQVLLNNFLAKPLESRPRSYHTTLCFPNSGTSFYTNQIKQILAENKDSIKMLPQKSSYSVVVNETIPYGLYFDNKNKHILIINSSLLSFSGITESCHFCPMNFELRKEILDGMNDTIKQATNLFLSDKDHNITTSSNASLNKFLDIGQSLDSTEPSLKKTAWMEINVFGPQDVTQTITQNRLNSTAKTEQQKQLIQYIVNSKLDALWISICPNCYYSPIARQKDKEKKMLDAISNFTAQLQSASKENNFTTPKILIGFEIANNLYDAGLPKNFAIDVYGNSYQDIPDPLDTDFWQNEIETPLAKFVENWNKPEIGNGIAISGIMLDLEMYCRKTSGIFLTTMGVTQRNLSEFLKEQNLKPTPMTMQSSINFLMNNKLSQKYFEFLEVKARKLGIQIKNSCEKQIPNCIIALYMPNVLSSWFYKGLYQGLCKVDQPIYLFSFNAEFNYHRDWFIQNNINAHHSSVLLLSKLTNSESFKLTSEILKHHNGVWLNRFSRLVEPKTNDWTSVEKPMFPENTRQKLTSEYVDYLGKI